MIKKLKEMADQNTETFLGPIIQFLHDEIKNKGAFEWKGGKYHWVRKNKHSIIEAKH